MTELISVTSVGTPSTSPPASRSSSTVTANASASISPSTTFIPERTYRAALDFGCQLVSAPQRTERWPVTIAFVTDLDGYLVEFVQRHPWLDGDTDSTSWVGQYCLNVSDIDSTIVFYELLGFQCSSRTDIPQAKEAIIENPDLGGKLQLAQQLIEPQRLARWPVTISFLADPDAYQVELVQRHAIQ